MKRTILSIGLTFLVIMAVNVIGQEAQPLKHTKKVYVDGDGGLYIPDKKKIYLRLSFSPEENSPSLLLRNQASKSARTPEPFLFEGPGLHTIVHSAEHYLAKVKNAPTPADIFFVNVDANPPKTKIEASKAPFVVNRKVTIFGKPVSLTLSSTDDSSGVEAAFYSVNGAEFTQYRTPVRFDRDADYGFRYYGLDNVGNAAKVLTKLYSVDLTAPTTSHSVEKYSVGNVLCPLSKIKLRGRDVKAGIATVNYKFDGQKESKVYGKKALSLKNLSEGEHKILYFSADRVSNVEEAVIYNFYMDRTPPIVTAPILGDQYRSDRLYVSGRSRIEIKATDNKVGVGKIRYDLNSKTNQRYSKPFGLPVTNKHYTIGYFAQDNLCNISKKKTMKVTLDINSPKMKLDFSGNHYFIRNIHYVRSSTRISLKVSDNLSGVKFFSYSLDSNPAVSSSAPFSIAIEGAHSLLLSASDNVNNRTGEQTANLIVDDTSPEIFTHFSVSSLESTPGATPPSRAGAPGMPSFMGTFPRKSLLFLAATDKSAGVAKIQYSLNGGKRRPNLGAIRFKKTGEFSVNIITVDNVGNEAQKEIKFSIKNE